MYMPGRSRTGSRPSKTVMSLAVYVFLVIKKALLMGYFRAGISLSDPAVGTGRQTRLGSLRNSLSESWILDRRGDPRPLGAIGVADLRHDPSRSFHRFPSGLR